MGLGVCWCAAIQICTEERGCEGEEQSLVPLVNAVLLKDRVDAFHGAGSSDDASLQTDLREGDQREGSCSDRCVM